MRFSGQSKVDGSPALSNALGARHGRTTGAGRRNRAFHARRNRSSARSHDAEKTCGARRPTWERFRAWRKLALDGNFSSCLGFVPLAVLEPEAQAGPTRAQRARLCREWLVGEHEGSVVLGYLAAGDLVALWPTDACGCKEAPQRAADLPRLPAAMSQDRRASFRASSGHLVRAFLRLSIYDTRPPFRACFRGRIAGCLTQRMSYASKNSAHCALCRARLSMQPGMRGAAAGKDGGLP
jgi:hypothetical protein